MTDFENLAACIKQSAKIREESYETKEFSTIADTYGEYKYSISEAVDKTPFNQQTKTLANLLLFTAWNDALDWADTQVYPAEMAFVEACYTVCNTISLEVDYNGSSELKGEDWDTLSEEFQKSAEGMRKSLYGFGAQ